MARGLSEMQKGFVAAYSGEAEGNGTLAMELAGSKANENSRAATAAKWLRMDKIKDALKEASKEVASSRIASRQERQEFLSEVLRGELMLDHVREDGERVEKAPEVKDRLTAVKTLGQMQGDFVKRVEVAEKPAPFVVPRELEEDEWASLTE